MKRKMQLANQLIHQLEQIYTEPENY